MTILRTTLFTALTLFSSIVISQNSSIQLIYTPDKDTLSLTTDQVKLKTILGLLSLKSGIQTSIHPDADKKLSIVIKNQPLEQAIKRLCLNFNCITHFDLDSQTDENVITRLEVLPKGQHQLLMLTETIPIANEMNIHARKHQTNKYSRIQKRLELRLNNLPEAIRESIAETYSHQIKHYQDKELERTKRRAERDKDIKDRDDHRQAINAKFKKQNPERFALSEQRRKQDQRQH